MFGFLRRLFGRSDDRDPYSADPDPSGATPGYSDSPLRKAFERCGVFVRDTTLLPGFLEKYKVGLLLTDPTYCDASSKLGGFVAPHRFLIISSNARSLDEIAPQIAPQPWGLCVWQRNRIFKVIDKAARQGRVQIALLEIPEELLRFFQGEELTRLERSFAEQARASFEQYYDASPVAELDDDRWRERLVYPIGINDQGEYFPLGQEPPSGGQGMRFEIVGSPPTEVGDEVVVADDIRRGDLVGFVRVAPQKVALRVLSAEEAVSFSGKKYRIDRGSDRGTIKLVQVGDAVA